MMNKKEKETKKPEIVYAIVREVELKEGKLLTPLLPLERPETTHLQATICFDLHKHGIAWNVLKMKYDLSMDWTVTKVKEYIQQHGRLMETEESLKHRGPRFFETEITFEGIGGIKGEE